MNIPLKKGDKITNNELCKIFGVAPRGGLRKSEANNCLVIVNDIFGPNPYIDKELDGLVYYTGMGKTGDQSVAYSQNRTLATSRFNNLELHYFDVTDRGIYNYRGQVELAGDPITDDPKLCRQPDANGEERWVVIFPLKFVEAKTRRFMYDQ